MEILCESNKKELVIPYYDELKKRGIQTELIVTKTEGYSKPVFQCIEDPEHSSIVIIGCTKTKTQTSGKARDVFSASSLFRKEVKFIEENYTIPWVIVSGKLGVIHPDEIISPYTFEPKKMLSNPQLPEHIWFMGNIHIMLSKYKTIFAFCGKEFADAIRKACPNTEVIEPLKGMGIGQRLKYLTRST